jgi:hypothetical protein
LSAPASLFGIRHHGPGSARRLVEALEALKPTVVLIEGPSDATPLLPLLAHPAMITPVALLAYAEDDASRASFFPFARYSPEYQATVWAVANGAELRFIDLPSTDRLAATAPEDTSAPADADPVSYDPIGVLAKAAGYDDGESWWSDTIEQNLHGGAVFDAVTDAMTALRETVPPPTGREAAREAYMRLEIAKAVKEASGPVAVVCGAWHVPALAAKHSATADREILKGRIKAKVKATWTPWTTQRLARATGYGAGVVSPGWFSHLWENGDRDDRDAIWLTRMAMALRDRGHEVSTASLIDAQMLASALATLRDRPAAGFEELTEAAVSVFCAGDPSLWHEVSDELLIGGAVGEIPPETPLAPLIEDLQRQQKAVRLKPEALERELSLDLRTDAGLARSTLLHRLTILGVPWGRLADGGRSRGTFREIWKLVWDPEFSVSLIENTVHGATIRDAADARTMETMRGEGDIADLATAVREAMVADLSGSVSYGIRRLESMAALDADSLPLLQSLPPMADMLRYGEARAGQTGPIEALMPRVVARASLSLHYAVRDLDAPAAETMRTAVQEADDAIRLAKLGENVRDQWLMALERIPGDLNASPLIVGAVARMLYEADRMTAEDTSTLLGRMLSPGRTTADAAAFFEGFFTDSGPRMVHDGLLRGSVDEWMAGLDEEEFVATLPLFRRAFGRMDAMERRRLMDAVFDKRAEGARGYVETPGATAAWPALQARILELIEGNAA